jgi:hypothetical protein
MPTVRATIMREVHGRIIPVICHFAPNERPGELLALLRSFLELEP